MTMSFYLNGSEAKSKLVMLKIYDSQFAGRRFVYSTKEYIDPQLWDVKKGCAKRDLESLNVRLKAIQAAATSYVHSNRHLLTKEGLKAHLDALRPQEQKVIRPKGIVEEWKDFIEAEKGNVSNQTIIAYRSSCETFEKFLKDREFMKKRRLSYSVDLTIQELNYSHYQSYQIYLKQVPVTEAQDEVSVGYKSNTIAKKTKQLKMFLNHMQRVKGLTHLDFSFIKYKERPGFKLALSEDDVEALLNATFEGSLDQIRDLFVLHCMTGLRISDFMRLDKHIQGTKISMTMKKTKKSIDIPLTPIMSKILSKYQFCLPKMSEQHYRKGIKDVYKAVFPERLTQLRQGDKFVDVPLWKLIRSHDAVRTFITLSHSKGMSISSIAKITGKSIKVLTSNYLVESQVQAEKEMANAWGSTDINLNLSKHLKISSQAA